MSGGQLFKLLFAKQKINLTNLMLKKGKFWLPGYCSFSFRFSVREQLKELTNDYDKSENNLKALQSVGQIVGEVLKQLTEEKYIVKATNGPRYVVGIRRGVDKTKLRQGTRVALDMTTLTIMR